ncbi:MAG: DUF4395 domain-containing protein [Dehalococcoidia bacterium]|nr:DUF4395 domain-containing protein [Dehalococcoidia bacterium]
MRVDRSALKTNQALIVILTVLAFVLGGDAGTWLVLFTGLVLAIGTVAPPVALFQQIYHRLLKPLGLVRPNVIAEDPMPHRFAQGLGAVFLLAATAFLLAGSPAVGWTLSWIVTALAFINFTINFCAGCFIYFQLARLGLIRSAGHAQAP